MGVENLMRLRFLALEGLRVRARRSIDSSVDADAAIALLATVYVDAVRLTAAASATATASAMDFASTTTTTSSSAAAATAGPLGHGLRWTKGNQGKEYRKRRYTTSHDAPLSPALAGCQVGQRCFQDNVAPTDTDVNKKSRRGGTP